MTDEPVQTNEQNALKVESKQRRRVLITTPPTRWTLQVEDDWDALNEDERQAYIYEAAMDNDELPRFHWENPL
jgi:hypothetical protein